VQDVNDIMQRLFGGWAEENTALFTMTFMNGANASMPAFKLHEVCLQFAWCLTALSAQIGYIAP